jgi:hypothetical protein
MKTTTKTNWIPLMMVLSCLLIVCTLCKKKESDTPAGVSAQRITGTATYFLDTLASRYTFIYAGSLLTEVISDDSLPAGGYKTVFQYAGNTISSCMDFYKHNNSWQKEEFTEINGYNGDNPLEIISHSYDENGIDRYQHKTNFTYNGSLLIMMDEYFNENGTWINVGKTLYTYDSKGRIQQETDTSSSYGHITTYHYDADNMTEAVSQGYYEGHLSNSGKTTYEYSAGRLSESAYYNWDSNDWTIESTTQYGYNEYGNIVSERILSQGSIEMYRVEVTYGEGTGNYRKCAQIETGIPIFPGDPTPYPVKSRGHQSGRIQNSLHK